MAESCSPWCYLLCDNGELKHFLSQWESTTKSIEWNEERRTFQWQQCAWIKILARDLLTKPCKKWQKITRYTVLFSQRLGQPEWSLRSLGCMTWTCTRVYNRMLFFIFIIALRATLPLHAHTCWEHGEHWVRSCYVDCSFGKLMQQQIYNSPVLLKFLNPGSSYATSSGDFLTAHGKGHFSPCLGISSMGQFRAAPVILLGQVCVCPCKQIRPRNCVIWI